MTYKYQPALGPGGSKEITIHLNFGGKLQRVVFHSNKFEKTIDKIDIDIALGMTFAQIQKKYASAIIRVGNPEPVAAATKADKKTIVREIIENNPHFNLGEVSRAASKSGAMSYANARYLAQQIMENTK